MTAPWDVIARALHGALAPSGFDLGGATRPSASPERFGLPEVFGSDRLLVCVGNTRALWAPLVEAVRTRDALRASEHPVDDYARAVIGPAAAAVAERFGVQHLVRYAADDEAPRLDVVHLAEAAGLGHRAPSRLLVHPTYGPWIGLRAAVLFDVAGPTDGPRPAPPCASCAARPCVAAYEAAVAASGGEARVDQASLTRDYPLWRAVRDVCPVGRDARYDDAQAEYHYTKRRSLLG